MSTTIRIPVSKTLKNEAEAASRFYGFSSLTEALQTLVQKLSKRELPISQKEVIHLSKAAKKRYAKIAEEIEAGKNVTKTKSLDKLFQLLEV